MNPISNIWNHPRTSAAGLLIAVITIAGALSRQGVTLGIAGNDTVITLVGAIATALLGLLARDPESAPSSATSTPKIGAWAMIALLLPLQFVGGCSGVTVAQDIVNWTPALQGAVATVDSTGALLAPASGSFGSVRSAGRLLAASLGSGLANRLVEALGHLFAPGPSFRKSLNQVSATYR